MEAELEMPLGGKGGLGNSVSSTMAGGNEGEVFRPCDGESI